MDIKLKTIDGKEIKLTIREWHARATRGSGVFKNRKKYCRKLKHSSKESE